MIDFIFLKRVVFLGSALFFVSLISACTPNAANDSDLRQMSTPPQLETRDYRIRPMDMIRFEMFQEPENRGEYRVSGDGNITLYLLGPVKVAGLTLREAKAKIEEDYRNAAYYVNPQVSLQIVSYAERRVYVDGFVGAVGPVLMPMEENLTLIRAITAARGLLPRASRTNVILVRKTDGEDKTYIINLKEIQEGNAQDILLQEGDKIYVQDSKI